MRVVFCADRHKPFTVELGSRDVIIHNTLYNDLENVYNVVLEEVNTAAYNWPWFWKTWNRNAHLVAGGYKFSIWKKKCPILNLIIDRIRFYFKMDIKKTRLNWYRDQSDWKPYHHDSPAIRPEKYKNKQNTTVGVSFGNERHISFMENKSKKVITFPLPNGSLFGFTKDINIDWKHSVPKIPYEK